MKRTVRIVSLAMVVVFVFAMLLSGCGSANAQQPAQSTAAAASSAAATSAASSAAASTQAALPPVELNWYLPVPPQKDTQLVEQSLDAYMKDKINATIKLNFLDWATFNDKFPVLMAAGENVDIMFTAGWLQYPQSVAKGYFADITDMLDQYAPKTKANLPKQLFDGAKINGRIYAVPTSKELAHTQGYLWSTDIAAKTGVEADMQKLASGMPAIQDIEPILLKVHKADPSIYPIQTVLPIKLMDFDPVGDENVPGSLYPNKDTKVVDEWETPEVMDMLKTVHRFYQEGLIRKDAVTVKDIEPDKKAQKYFMLFGTTKPLQNEEMGTAYGYKMEQFSMTKPFITSNDATGSMNAITANSQNKERALMFLELVNTDPVVNNTLNYGVENTHWVKKGDNLIDFAPGLDAKTTGYMPNAFWQLGNQFLNYFMVGQNTNKWNLYKEYNDQGIPSKILGFNFDAEPVKTQIAAVTNVLNELRPAIETGTVDPTVYLPKMITKMKDAGLDQIIAEKQKQIDAWLAATSK